MANDLISRSKVEEIISTLVHEEGVTDEAAILGCMVWNAVHTMAGVDVTSVMRGQWYKPKGMMPPEHHGRHRCSVCDQMAYYERPGRESLSDYCPNCGAKMRN